MTFAPTIILLSLLVNVEPSIDTQPLWIDEFDLLDQAQYERFDSGPTGITQIENGHLVFTQTDLEHQSFLVRKDPIQPGQWIRARVKIEPTEGATKMVGGLILTNDRLQAELADGRSADPFSDGHYIANWNMNGAFEVEIISAGGGKSDRDLDHAALDLTDSLNAWYYHDIHYNPPHFITMTVWDSNGHVLGNRILPTHGLNGPMYLHLIAAKGAVVKYDFVGTFDTVPEPPLKLLRADSEHPKPQPQLTKPLYWSARELKIAGSSPGLDFEAIVELINDQKLDEALQRTQALTGPTSAYQRGVLLLAIAGHLQFEKPDELIDSARRTLEDAREANPDDDLILRLLNQIQIYQEVPNDGIPPDSFIIHLRTLGEIALGPGQTPIREVGTATTPFFRGFRAFAWAPHAMSQVRSDLNQLARSNFERIPSNDPQFIAARGILNLLEEQQKHAWAKTTIDEGELLRPRRLLSWIRKHYWWWVGLNMPMNKIAFDSYMTEMNDYFPQLDAVRMYRGEQVPWGSGIRPDDLGAPLWAVNQCELRRRVDHVVEWWFNVRQSTDGSLGGGWEDDCEVLRQFAITSLACGNPIIERGIARLVDGIWNSGEIVQGYDRSMKDVQHSSELSSDSSIMITLAYGDPLYFERFLETTKTTDEIHTAVNDFGHRHYKSSYISATQVDTDPARGFDVNYCGRAMRTPAMIAWYSRIPRAVELVHGWAKAWSEDTIREGKDKPAGIMPTAVRFSDDTLDGNGRWWDPGLGSLYAWRTNDHDMVIGKILGAWMLTRDDSVLEGLRAQFELVRQSRAHPVNNAEPGSTDWAGMHMRSNVWNKFSRWYRQYTFDTQFDDIAGPDQLITKDNLPAIAGALENDLDAMRFNLPMLTSETLTTDRILLKANALLPQLTGSTVDIVQPPSFAVSWRNVGPDFAGLVRCVKPNIKAWLYSFSEIPIEPSICLWRLSPGRYELRLGPDPDANGQIEDPIQIITFECGERLNAVPFELPPSTLYHMEVSQLEAWPEPPEHLPDLAIHSRDLRLQTAATVGSTYEGELTVHNIGSADASNVMIEIRAIPRGDPSKSQTIALSEIDELPHPADLVAKSAVKQFQWRPEVESLYTIEARVQLSDDSPEVCSTNNVATIDVRVKNN